MSRRHGLRRLCFLLASCGLATMAMPARAQKQGFQVNRYEPTTSGSPFFVVEHPYYSSVRSLAVGLNLDYAHDVLRYGESQVGLSGIENLHSIIAHQLIAHLDVAGAIADRVLLSASLPLILLERGEAAGGISPVETVAVSDPRLAVAVRAYRQPHRDPFSVHGTFAFWIPLRAINGSLPQDSSDQGARLRASVVFSGLYRSLIWSATLGFTFRSTARLGSQLSEEGATTGPEAQVGIAAAYSFPRYRINVGPEILLSTSLLPTQAFQRPFTSLEILVTAQHNIAKLVNVGLGVGIGMLSAPGTPDARLLVRLAYAPLTRDRDQDGIRDELDYCPDQKGVRSDVPSNNGCPVIPDRDCDGVPDVEDECPDEPEGRRPHPNRMGCPRSGRDDAGGTRRNETPAAPASPEPEPAPAPLSSS